MAEEAKKDDLENQEGAQEKETVEENKDLRNEDGDLVIKLGIPESGEKKEEGSEEGEDEEGAENKKEDKDSDGDDNGAEDDEGSEGDDGEKGSEGDEEEEDKSEEGSGGTDNDGEEEDRGEQSPELPENIQKLVDFMKETGGTMEDFINLNREYTNDDILIREWVKSTNPDFDRDEVDFEIEERFSYNEDDDDEKDIKRKKLAKKRAIREAKAHFDGLKDKYYDEVKLTKQVPKEAKEAVEFHKQYLEQEAKSKELGQKRGEHFTKASNDFFNGDFKGFEFTVGEQSLQFEVKDVNSVNEAQNNLFKVFNKYTDQKTGMLKDAAGYHKAIFAARNADSIAKHFYELGKADQVKSSAAESKNIDMDGRKEGSPEGGDSKKIKVRDVTNDDVNTFSSGKLRINAK